MKISVLLLAMLAGGAVSAEPAHGGGMGGRGFFGFAQGHFAGRDAARRDGQLQRQQERRAERRQANDAGRCDRAGYGEHSCAGPEGAPKRNRLTPEERRALRRQIQNAGKELYVPGR